MSDVLESSTLERWKKQPVDFIREVLRNPKDGLPFELFPAQLQWFEHCWKLRGDGRLLYPEQLIGWIKQTGKTTTAGIQELTTLLVYGGRYAEAYCVASDLQQAQERVFGEIRKIIESSPLLKREAQVTQSRITFPQTGATITALAAGSGADIAGSHPTFVSVDEIWTINDERGRRMWDELIPTPTQQISVRLVTTHAGYSDECELLEEIYTKGLALPEIAPNLRGGKGMLFTWRHEPLAPWQTPQWLDDMKNATRPLQYLRQYENRFVNNRQNYITTPMYDRIVRDLPPPSGRLVIYVAVDAGWKRDYAAVVAVTIDGDQIRYVYEKVFKPTPDHILDFENTIEKSLRYLHEHCTIRLCYVDPTQMEHLKQRMQKIKIPIEALTQNPANKTAMAQCLYDLFRTERFSISSDFNNISELRDTITRTAFEEKSGGLRIAERQSIKTDLTVATAMACLAAQQNDGKSGYRLDVFDSDFRDEDLPPLPSAPEPASGAVCGTSDWWKFKQHLNSYTGSADTQLKSLYGAVDNFFRYR